MGKLKVLDIFSGIGGFSLGLERAGMETIAFCEIDPHCREVLKKHWPNTVIFKDITKMFKPTIAWPKEKWGNLKSDIDVICGGFPCQDISVAGKQKGLEGERSGLWKEFHRIIKEVQPRYAIIENVANLRSKGLSQVIQDLWEIGYSCEWHIISASAIGAFHKRERIWIIAYPNSTELWEQPRGELGKEGEDKIQFGVNGKERTICNSSSKRCDGCARKERHVQTNKEWDDKKVHTQGEQCLSIPRENGQILSRRSIENIKSSYSKQWELVSRVRRVVNGLSKGMERDRKQRIKQLGNAVVPQIPELIGREILRHEGLNHGRRF